MNNKLVQEELGGLSRRTGANVNFSPLQLQN